MGLIVIQKATYYGIWATYANKSFVQGYKIIWVAFHVDQGPWDEEILVWDICRTLSDTKQRQIKHKIIQDNILVIYKSTCMQFIFISQNILYVTLISQTHGLYLGSFDTPLSWV